MPSKPAVLSDFLTINLLMLRTLAAMLLLGPVAASAIPFQITGTTHVSSNGTPGVSDGDLLTVQIVADNGGASALSQDWFQTDVLSATASAGSYVAVFNYPFYLNDPVFRTNAAGAVTSAWFDIDSNNTDNLGSGSPGFFSNALVTSQNNFLGFQGAFTWTIASAPASAPEPATLALLGLGLAGFGFGRRRRAG